MYAAGRRGQAWRKVKPVRTFDLVVLGAEWGHGRRRGWLSNLHLGARDPETGAFVMVGKTFKGLTDELLAVADRCTARLASPGGGGHGCSSGPSSSSKSRSTASRPRRATPAGSRCALRASRHTGRTRSLQRRTRLPRFRRLLGAPALGSISHRSPGRNFLGAMATRGVTYGQSKGWSANADWSCGRAGGGGGIGVRARGGGAGGRHEPRLPKPRFLTGRRTTLRVTCASEGRGGSSVTVTAIWPRNAALFIYFTNKSCATTHRKAKALIRSEGNEGFVFDELLPANGDRGWSPRSATSSSAAGRTSSRQRARWSMRRTGAAGSAERSSVPTHGSSPDGAKRNA